jgi:hypothetical protein
MSEPMTKKEWAVSQGLAKPGPGRLPKAAHAAIEQARKDGVRFSDDVGAPIRRSKTHKGVDGSEPHPATTKAARATQERLAALSEDALFEVLTLRKVSFSDKAGHRTRATVTGRRELFWTGFSLTLGESITFSTDVGWHTVPLKRFIKVGKVDTDAVAAHKERLKIKRALKRAKKASAA